MHEASIALSIISIAGEHCKRAGAGRIQSITVKVGGASGVLPYALLSAFDIVKAGTIAGEASLIIEEIPLGGVCKSCGNNFSTSKPFILECPNCGSADFLMNSGRELDVTEIEVDG